MSTRNRIGNKWTVNEVLSLQREFELLEWDIDQIAEKHGRTANAIMYKLDQEGFADYDDLYCKYCTNLNTNKSVKPVSNNSWIKASLADESDDEEEEDDDEDYMSNEESDDEDDDEDDEDDEEDEDDPLTERVAKMESGLDKIMGMIKDLERRLLNAEKVTRTNDRPSTTLGC